MNLFTAKISPEPKPPESITFGKNEKGSNHVKGVVRLMQDTTGSTVKQYGAYKRVEGEWTRVAKGLTEEETNEYSAQQGGLIIFFREILVFPTDAYLDAIENNVADQLVEKLMEDLDGR